MVINEHLCHNATTNIGNLYKKEEQVWISSMIGYTVECYEVETLDSRK